MAGIFHLMYVVDGSIGLTAVRCVELCWFRILSMILARKLVYAPARAMDEVLN